MARRQKVPSVAEIAAQMALSAAGVTSPAQGGVITKPSYEELEAQIVILTTEVEHLRLQLSSRPAKMLAADNRKGIADAMKERDFVPVDEMIDMYESGALTNDQKIKILTELQGYVAPKLKSVEQTSSVDLNMTVVIKRFGDKGLEPARQIPIDVEAIRSRTSGELLLAK